MANHLFLNVNDLGLFPIQDEAIKENPNKLYTHSFCIQKLSYNPGIGRMAIVVSMNKI
jgi:hypothetical protein